MGELTRMILRIGFLLLLWLFIFAIVYALRSDLFGAPVRKLPSTGTNGGDGSANRQAAAPVAATPVSAGAASQGTAPPITPSGGALLSLIHI